ncbi:MAG: FAD binding domain-containing protein [Maritimibacter sp.]
MRYHVADSFEDAVRLAQSAEGVTRFLAGGTDVLVQMRAGLVTPDNLIDLKHIPGVHEIERRADGGWRIGIAVPGAVLGKEAALVADWPGVVEARVALGAVAPTVLLVADAAEALIGSALDEAAMERFVAAVRAAAKPISDKRATAEFRTEVVGVMAKRAAMIAYSRAKGEGK